MNNAVEQGGAREGSELEAYL